MLMLLSSHRRRFVVVVVIIDDLFDASSHKIAIQNTDPPLYDRLREVCTKAFPGNQSMYQTLLTLSKIPNRRA
jgi:hypothetical protein